MLELGGQGAEGSGIEASSGDQSAKRGKNFSPSFFSYQDGLSWHLRALCYQDQCCKVAEESLLFIFNIIIT